MIATMESIDRCIANGLQAAARGEHGDNGFKETSV